MDAEGHIIIRPLVRQAFKKEHMYFFFFFLFVVLFFVVVVLLLFFFFFFFFFFCFRFIFMSGMSNLILRV